MPIAAYNVQLLFANNAQSTLAGAITNTATTAQLAAGTGTLFPVPGAGQGFALTLQSASNPAQIEVVLVTAMSGDTITTMVRGQEGTTAQAFVAGDSAAMLPTAGTMTSVQQGVQATPARALTVSGAFLLTNADGAVGLTASAASSSTMPPAPTNGQVVEIADMAGNFNQFPITLSANAGQSFSIHDQNNQVILNVPGQVASFKWYASINTWSVRL